jgi:hypothetical protein
MPSATEIRGTGGGRTTPYESTPWARLSRATRDAIQAEATALPLPGVDRPVEVVWTT